jgi:hypothetical protein
MKEQKKEAKTEGGSEKEVFIIIKRQQHAEAVFDDSTTFRRSKKSRKSMHNVHLKTDFPDLPSVSASMFNHFEPDNDFAIRCTSIPTGRTRLKDTENLDLSLTCLLLTVTTLSWCIYQFAVL